MNKEFRASFEMREFKIYLKEKSVKAVSPDFALARSLIELCKMEDNFAEK